MNGTCLVAAVLVWVGVLATASGQTTVLYDPAAAGGTQRLDEQGWLYLAADPVDLLNGSQAVTAATLDPGNLTRLDTTTDRNDYAGFFTHSPFTGLAVHPSAVALDRTVGFTLSFDLQVLAETQNARDDNADGEQDRAGFSVLIVTSDQRALELAFSYDDAGGLNRIWAYDDGTTVPANLFTQAEGADRTTLQLTTLTRYDLAVSGTGYSLRADGSPILGGLLRDYTAFTGLVDPYDKPNLIFLGDDTSSADSHVRIGRVAIVVPEPAAATLLAVLAVATLHRRGRRPRRL